MQGDQGSEYLVVPNTGLRSMVPRCLCLQQDVGMEIYINGRLAGTTTRIGPAIHNDMIFSSAMDTMAGHHFHGMMDEIRIYNRALTALEVRRLYSNRK